MNRARIERRSFLKAATQTLLAVPAASALSGFVEAQQATPAKPAHAAAHVAPKVPAKPAVTLNVRDFGATGDGKTKDTLAIQQTIERCSMFGGGEVEVPAGDYLTGAQRKAEMAYSPSFVSRIPEPDIFEHEALTDRLGERTGVVRR